jgi:transposase InsO family protein
MPYPQASGSIRGAQENQHIQNTTPYLLSAVVVSRPSQVWRADITYVHMAKGFMYLVAIIDWWSRDVLAWQLSNT